jgi:hypothetical protein
MGYGKVTDRELESIREIVGSERMSTRPGSRRVDIQISFFWTLTFGIYLYLKTI